MKFSTIGSFLACVFFCYASSAHGFTTTITFDSSTSTRGDYVGSDTELGFTYSFLSGSLFYNHFGNLGNDMEGEAANGGGVLDVRTAGVKSPFTFDQVDYAAYALSSSSNVGTQTLIIYGLLNSVLVGIEQFTLPNSAVFNPSYDWQTETANALAGKNIDELQFVLKGLSNDDIFSFQAIDNVVLGDAVPVSPVPEPSALGLLGTGVLGVAAIVRQKLTQS